MSQTTTEVREVGPFKVISNGRVISTTAGRVKAERLAAKLHGSIVQGRQITVTAGLGDGR